MAERETRTDGRGDGKTGAAEGVVVVVVVVEGEVSAGDALGWVRARTRVRWCLCAPGGH